MDNFNSLEEEYQELLVERECALRSAVARIENIRTVVEHERSKSEGFKSDSPFDAIKSRLKTFESALGKLEKRGWEHFDKMKDVAGIRIITHYVSDVYEIRDILRAQIEKTKPKNAMRIVEEEDYIKNPKPNGYRSLHILVEVKVSAVKGDKAKWIPVEVQIRTKSQDLWASYEHRFKYKNPKPSHDIEEKFSEVANYLKGLDEMLEQLRDENDEEALGIEDLKDLSVLENFDTDKN